MRVQSLLLVSLLVLAGCGSVTEDPVSGDPSISEQPTTLVTPSDDEDMAEPNQALPHATDDASVDADDGIEPEANSGTHNGAAIALPVAPNNPGFHLGSEFTTDDGTYRRLVMPRGYENVIDSAIISRSSIDLPEEDIEEALVFTGKFAAEELATSELAFNYSEDGARDWLDDHRNLFIYPDRVERGLLNTDDVTQSLALLYTDNGWDRGEPERLTRVQNLDVQLLSIEQSGDRLIISHLVTFDSEVSGTGGLSGTFTEKTRLHATYTVVQVSNEWKIADYETSWDTRY